MAQKSFTEKLSGEALAYFCEVTKKPFSQQAVAFLNAYWPEVHDEAPFIFEVAWETIKYADMHFKGIQYIHQYEEGTDLDFDSGLYFYEHLVKFVEDPKNSAWKEFKRSQPEMMTAIKRKQELREKVQKKKQAHLISKISNLSNSKKCNCKQVDVNFDGRIAFLEYLLYQYRDVANPSDFCTRSMNQGDEHPEIRKARLALEEVNKRIRAYEAEKQRLEMESKEPGVKGLKAVNMLAQIDSSPLKDELNKALITAEAAVRTATKKFGGQSGSAAAAGGAAGAAAADGAIWWMNKDLEIKQKRYGPQKK
jgi:hypothetical protein